MKHATSFVCSCRKLVAAGWTLRCNACGFDNLPLAVTPAGDNGGGEIAMSYDPPFAWAHARDMSVTDAEAAAFASSLRKAS